MLLKVINEILSNKGMDTIEELSNDMDLRKDIGFDSFDLAELTVKIEKEYQVDIFENGIISTIEEVKNRIDM